jgi:ligand-binding sensor domain-containing protein
MKLNPLLLACVMAVSLCMFSRASRASYVPPYVHNVWQTQQGLPQNSVFTIVQTRDGYLWLATQEGLVRFDGIRFTIFDKRNTPQIKANNIQALYEDQEGALWAGTEGGAACIGNRRLHTEGLFLVQLAAQFHAKFKCSAKRRVRLC